MEPGCSSVRAVFVLFWYFLLCSGLMYVLNDIWKVKLKVNKLLPDMATDA